MDDNAIGIIFGLIGFPLWYGSAHRLRGAVEAEGGRRYALIALSILLFFFGFIFMGMANVNAPIAIRHFFIPISFGCGWWGWYAKKNAKPATSLLGSLFGDSTMYGRAEAGGSAKRRDNPPKVRGDAFDAKVSRGVLPNSSVKNKKQSRAKATKPQQWESPWKAQSDATGPNDVPQTNTRTVAGSGDVARPGGLQDVYDKLVALNGCGPVMAERIISKVSSDKKLTNHEQMFWDQVQNTGSLLDIFPDPTSDVVYVSEAEAEELTEAFWVDFHELLVALDGCGPATADRIIEKMTAEKELTDREKSFVDQLT